MILPLSVSETIPKDLKSQIYLYEHAPDPPKQRFMQLPTQSQNPR